jgi:DNA-binding NtrC family response regulator
MIDDEPLLGHSLVCILQQAGYFVAYAENWRDSVSLIESEKFDVAVLDPYIPDTDSFALLDLLHLKCPQTRAIIFSSDARDITIQRAFQKGALAYLIKPIEPMILLQVIADLLVGKPIYELESVIPNRILNRGF